MELHRHSKQFKEVVETVAEDIGLLPFQVEKDYYVSLILKELSKIEEVTIVFKGGTSLSKCYDVIERFSEDIDLAVYFESHKLGEGKRKRLKETIKHVISKLGFVFLNEKKVESNKDYNKYEIGYQKIFDSNVTMVEHIIIETIVVYKPYPCEKRKVNNFITKYLENNDQNSVIHEYELEQFDMMIQTIDRTFIDKVFATCDYHLQNDYLRHSRHIYDLFKIWNSGFLNLSVVGNIVDDVIKDRQIHGISNLSCMPNQKPNEILHDIYKQAVYQKDYDDITMAFIYKAIDYETVVECIKQIYEAKIFPEVIINYK